MRWERLHEQKSLETPLFFIQLGSCKRYNMAAGSLCGKRGNSLAKTVQFCVKNFPCVRQNAFVIVEKGYKLATTPPGDCSSFFFEKLTSGIPGELVWDSAKVVFHNHTPTTINTIFFNRLIIKRDKAA
jgi:hypothetical protein